MEHLDALMDDRLLSYPEPPKTNLEPAGANHRYDAWVYSQYDWTQFDPKIYGYEVIRPVSRKYDFFTIISRRDKHQKKFRWKLRVEFSRDKNGNSTGIIKRVDVMRAYRRKGKDYSIYLARAISGAGAGVDAEHEKAKTLDNRRCSLRCTKRSENNHNWTERSRPKYPGLKRGVEWGDRLQQTIRGIIWWSTVNGDRKCKRTPRMPFTPENVAKCHQWYLKERNKLYGHKKWAVGGAPIPPIVFPPKIGELPF